MEKIRRHFRSLRKTEVNNTQTLIHMEKLKKTIEATLVSPYIKDEKPISLLIVAKAESGKSSAMKMYRQNKGIIYVSDCTAYGLTRDVLPKIVSGEVKTILIPDLLTPLSKSAKTRQSLIAFLNNLIEEGIARITTYSMIWDRDVKANLITAVTEQALRDGRHDWAKIGFLSRFIVFSYSYSLSTVTEILGRYSEGKVQESHVDFKLPDEEVEIALSPTLADKLDPIATKIGEQFELYGIRAKINLRSLLKSLAYLNGRDIVEETDYKELLQLADYMNIDYNPLR